MVCMCGGLELTRGVGSQRGGGRGRSAPEDSAFFRFSLCCSPAVDFILSFCFHVGLLFLFAIRPCTYRVYMYIKICNDNEWW